MNCRRFQHRLYEYLDGTLSPGAQAAAETHLSGCAACRETLRAERQVAQSLSDKFRRTTDSLRLPPEVQRRLLAAIGEGRCAQAEDQGGVFWWRRLAWQLCVGAPVLIALVWAFLYVPAPRMGTDPLQPQLPEGGILVQFSYVVPTYTFRQEGGFVIDALTYQTNVINERLPARLARLK